MLAMRSLPRLSRAGLSALCLAALMAAPGIVARAEGGPQGLQFVADNATTARNAGTLVPNGFGGSEGSAVGAQSLNLPVGFSASVVATGLSAPRFMAFDGAGNLLVAEAGAGRVDRYASSGGSIAAGSAPETLVSGLNAPSNVAFWGGYLYVGETNAISRFAYDPSGGVGQREVVVPNLPTGGHGTRTVAFGPDGMMYVGVGSSCTICQEADERRAAILRYAPDGTGYERFAWGLRNPVGLAFQPLTGLLWATVNERDNQGNELPPDLFTVALEGQNFGWPNCQPPNATPQTSGANCSGVTPPTVGLQAHGAPLGVTFYAGGQFPADYANDAFVVQHGSWNRQPPAAPKLVRIHFDGSQPVSAQDFATGWQLADGSRWGRPAGVAVAPDGSLIVSDDQAGVPTRIASTAG